MYLCLTELFEIELFLHWNRVKKKNQYVYKTELFKKNLFMNKNGFGIYNLQWLMCHKTKANQTKYFLSDRYRY